MSLLDRLIAPLLDDRRAVNQLRELLTVRPLDAAHIELDGRQLVNFSSNNYLGLNCHPRILLAAQSAMKHVGFGTGAAALVTGHTEFHASAERALAAWKGTQAAVLLPSGYQANLAAIQTLAAMGRHEKQSVRFLVDKLAHASILDAVMAATDRKRNVRFFPHNHMEKLARLLDDSPPAQVDVVITESIFSMDGDAADLAGIAMLKKTHPFILMLDEAHASGVYGAAGAGYAHELGLAGLVDISVVTLSKALGGIGGAICASRAFCDGLINFGRAFIYTTALPAAAAAAAEAAIAVLRDEPRRQQRVRDLSRKTRLRLLAAGATILPGDSPVLCLLCGSELSAMNAAESLRKEGLLVTAVRPPTVAPASSRLRATLSCEHRDDEIDHLVAALIGLQMK